MKPNIIEVPIHLAEDTLKIIGQAPASNAGGVYMLWGQLVEKHNNMVAEEVERKKEEEALSKPDALNGSARDRASPSKAAEGK